MHAAKWLLFRETDQIIFPRKFIYPRYKLYPIYAVTVFKHVDFPV